ncbi:MAG: hypothetical protein JJE17_01720 [Peptostreptococcaceae bacterium]|nr:hypothetical protein [Peptostreptococcaceae bacterium]
MGLVKETCVAGSTIEVCLKMSSPKKKGERRAMRINVTPEKVKKINDRNAEKELTRILNHNFIPGDWHLVLTYSGEEPTEAQAKKDRQAFIRTVNTEFKKQNKIFKNVSVTEFLHERIHHHIVCSFIDYETIARLWRHGDVRPTLMKRDGNYKRLAAYLIKETTKTFRNDDSSFKRRFTCSRTIEKPEVRKEDVSFKYLNEEPKALPGYYIEQDSIRRGTHEITGNPYLEYTMLSLTKKPRIKKWKRGKRIKSKENYNHLLRRLGKEDQINFL